MGRGSRDRSPASRCSCPGPPVKGPVALGKPLPSPRPGDVLPHLSCGRLLSPAPWLLATTWPHSPARAQPVWAPIQSVCRQQVRPSILSQSPRAPARTLHRSPRQGGPGPSVPLTPSSDHGLRGRDSQDRLRPNTQGAPRCFWNAAWAGEEAGLGPGSPSSSGERSSGQKPPKGGHRRLSGSLPCEF